MSVREPNGQTYDLGHFEAMQLELALDVVIREMQPNRSLTDAEILDNAHEATLRELRRLIGHANVSITIRNS